MESLPEQGRFYGQIAVVTGGGSGIGKACAEQLAREGATVVIADQNAESAQSVASAIAIPANAATAVPMIATRL